MDVHPWWQRAGHSIWREAGFRERPSYQATWKRFAELEQHAEAFADAAARAIRKAAKASGGRVGKYVHVDATEAETHARLEHLGSPWQECRRRKPTNAEGQAAGGSGEAKPRYKPVTAGLSMDRVRDERHKRAEGRRRTRRRRTSARRTSCARPRTASR